MTNQELVQKLRLKQALVILPDGREGVLVTLQFRGEIPSLLDREARKKWLLQKFNDILDQVGDLYLSMRIETLSASAQTIEAICLANEIDMMADLAKYSGMRLDMVSPTQIL